MPDLDGALSRSALAAYFAEHNPDLPALLRHMDALDGPHILEDDPGCGEALQAISDNIANDGPPPDPDTGSAPDKEDVLLGLSYLCSSRALRILDYLRSRYGKQTIDVMLFGPDDEGALLRHRIETLSKRSLLSRALAPDRVATALYVFGAPGGQDDPEWDLDSSY